MATNDVRDILDMGGGEQGRAGQQVEPAKPTKESIMNPFKVTQYFTVMYAWIYIMRFVFRPLGSFALCSMV